MGEYALAESGFKGDGSRWKEERWLKGSSDLFRETEGTSPL